MQIENIKAIFCDEIFMIGRKLIRTEPRLKKSMETSSSLGGPHVIAAGDFYQIAPVRDIKFKDDKVYGWTTDCKPVECIIFVCTH